MKCVECNSNMRKAGIHINRKGKIQKWQCTNCGRYKLGKTIQTFQRGEK